MKVETLNLSKTITQGLKIMKEKVLLCLKCYLQNVRLFKSSQVRHKNLVLSNKLMKIELPK